MKKYTFICLLLCLCSGLGAQTWKAEIQRADGHKGTMTLKVKPGMKVIVNNLESNSDSLKVSKIIEGTFISGSSDFIRIKLNTVRSESNYANGIRQFKITPAKCYTGYAAPDTNTLNIPVRQIDYLSFQNEKKEGLTEIGEPIILGSILMVILSPLISYNFKEGKINANRYKYWALGSTAGMLVGFAIPITFATVYKQKNYQFRDGWPSKKAKVWKFR
ncbi:MAG: hypothetical protein HXX13_07390 [Bacteroidetes bacterium]|nr:hypothetical protein [Bacteroidota bacterium]